MCRQGLGLGLTIHTTFSIGKDVRLPYNPLGEEKLNSLHTKYRDLQLLIVDEISMVDHNLLSLSCCRPNPNAV